MASREIIEELAIDMHKKKTHMQDLHQRSQICNVGAWKAEDEAFYQIARAEYYKAKNLCDSALTAYSTKGSGDENG